MNIKPSYETRAFSCFVAIVAIAMNSILSLFLLTALLTCACAFNVTRGKEFYCAAKRLESRNKLPQSYSGRDNGGVEVENCDEIIKSFEDQPYADLKIIDDDDILIRIFHLSKERFTNCVIGELNARDKTDNELIALVELFEKWFYVFTDELTYEHKYLDDDVELSKMFCLSEESFDNHHNDLLKKAQRSLASDLERERVLSCARVALRDEAIDKKLIDDDAFRNLTDTEEREIMKFANVTSVLESIVRCSEGDYFPIPKKAVKEVNCMIRHLKGKKMLDENFHPGLELVDEMENCEEYVKGLKEAFYKDLLDEWVKDDQKNASTQFNEPQVTKKYYQCRIDELKLRSYSDFALKEKLFTALHIPISYLKRQQRREFVSTRLPCHVSRSFDLAFDSLDSNATTDFEYCVNKFAIDNQLIDADYVYNEAFHDDYYDDTTVNRDYWDCKPILEKAALDPYIVAERLVNYETSQSMDYRWETALFSCSRTKCRQKEFGKRLLVLYALTQLNITDHPKQFERSKFIDNISNLTDRVMKCAKDNYRDKIYKSDELKTNCIIKDLKKKNILKQEFSEFNQTDAAADCHDKVDSIRNETMATLKCSGDLLESSINWNHLNKLYVLSVVEPISENTGNLKRVRQQTKSLLSIYCDFEKLFGSYFEVSINSNESSEAKVENYCITKYVIDKKLIDTKKFNVTLSAAEVDGNKCGKVIEKRTKEINFKVLGIAEKEGNFPIHGYDIVSCCALPRIRKAKVPEHIFSAQVLTSLIVDKEQKEIERKKFAIIAKDLALDILSCSIAWSHL